MKENIRKACDTLEIAKLRPIQNKAITSVLQGDDTIATLKTSGGKSAMYQVPAIMHPTQLTVVITPLVALMEDQVSKLQNCGIRAGALYYGNRANAAVLKSLEECAITLLYLSPERAVHILPWLEDCYGHIAMVVLDEAHCIVEWGNCFRPAYREIGQAIQDLKSKPTLLACSATLTESDRKEVGVVLGMECPKHIAGKLARPNIQLHKQRVSSYAQRYDQLEKALVKHGKKGCSVVYCNTKDDVEAVYEYLLEECQYKAESLCRCYSDLPNRLEEEQRFLKGKGRIMVATSAFGMGVDKSDIRLVVLFSLPLGLTSFVQQMGRCGRDGKKAHAYILHSQGDIARNRTILKGAGSYACQQLQQMVAYVESTRCMAVEWLGAYGEDAKPCGKCTCCQARGKKVKEVTW